MVKRPKYRRKFDKEFKMQAIKMILEEHLPVVEIVKRLKDRCRNFKQFDNSPTSPFLYFKTYFPVLCPPTRLISFPMSNGLIIK